MRTLTHISHSFASGYVLGVVKIILSEKVNEVVCAVLNTDLWKCHCATCAQISHNFPHELVFILQLEF